MLRQLFGKLGLVKLTPAEKAFYKLHWWHRILLRTEYYHQHKPHRLGQWLKSDEDMSYAGEVIEAQIISSSFIWSSSLKGLGYWESVSNFYISKHFKSNGSAQ